MEPGGVEDFDETTAKIEKVKALYDYKAQESDEITLVKGNVPIFTGLYHFTQSEVAGFLQAKSSRSSGTPTSKAGVWGGRMEKLATTRPPMPCRCSEELT